MRRRSFLHLMALVPAVAARPAGPAHATGRLGAEIAVFAGMTPVEDGLALDLPAIAESGYTVPVHLAPDGLAPGERLAAFRLFAPDNPFIRVCDVSFGPAATGRLAIRIRLARSQTVTGLARTSAGRVLRADRRVDVLAGGCGFDLAVPG